MISVIVPTMWYDSNFCNVLAKIVELEIVGEVIIINNDVSRMPSDPCLQHHKIKIHNMNENIYVNPSWNLGAQLAKYSVLAFLGDDVDINVNIFEKTHNLIESNQDTIGMVTVLCRHKDYEHLYDNFFTDDTIDFYKFNDPDPDESKRILPIGLGNLFFIQKRNWVKIPEETKIYHGEILVWNYIDKIKNNYIAANCRVNTKWHTTCHELNITPGKIGEEYQRIQHSDQRFCESIKFDLRNLPEYQRPTL